MTTVRRKPKVFNDEKEQRIQDLRNRIPKVIVELIITFVTSTNFQFMKSTMERLLLLKPIDIRRNMFSLPDGTPLQVMDAEESLINAYEHTIQSIRKKYRLEDLQNADFGRRRHEYPDDDRIEVNQYLIVTTKLENAVKYFKDAEKSSKNVFYTKHIEKVEYEIHGMCGLLFGEIVKNFYILRKPNFLLDKAGIPSKPSEQRMFYFKITTKTPEQKKEVTNFFRGLGAFVEWMRYN